MGREDKSTSRTRQSVQRRTSAQLVAVDRRALRKALNQPDVSFEKECLQLLFGILGASGLPTARLRAVCEDVFQDLRTARRVWNALDLTYFAKLAHVLSLWHLLNGYVNDRAEPKPLPLFGRGPSLAKLIRRVYPLAGPRAVLSTLQKVGAVRPHGKRWLPCGRALIFKSAHVARLRILTDLVRFLRTAQHNVSHAKGKLLQQAAFNPALPAAAIAELQNRLQERARQFLIEQDADFSRIEQSGVEGERTMGAGVGVYFYQDCPPARSARRAKSTKRILRQVKDRSR